jgi:small-conductance mechanosensitive channel
MDKRTISEMRKEVRSLQRQLATLGPVMRGSVVLIGTRNKQKYFSLNKDRKTHIIYLGEKRAARAAEYSANYKRLLGIVEEMTLLNMTLLKENADI